MAKKVHRPLLRQKRIERNKHIKPKAARRVSFKRFWRAMQGHKSLRGMRRKQARAVVRDWWQDEKRRKGDGEATDA